MKERNNAKKIIYLISVSWIHFPYRTVTNSRYVLNKIIPTRYGKVIISYFHMRLIAISLKWALWQGVRECLDGNRALESARGRQSVIGFANNSNRSCAVGYVRISGQPLCYRCSDIFADTKMSCTWIIDSCFQ